jgi:hypothetical protein
MCGYSCYCILCSKLDVTLYHFRSYVLCRFLRFEALESVLCVADCSVSSCSLHHLRSSFNSFEMINCIDVNSRLTLKLLLAPTITVILGSESHRTHCRILLSDGSGSLQTTALVSEFCTVASHLHSFI